MYRTPEGEKCAVGALIPDELYDIKFEKKSIATLLDSREDWFYPLVEALDLPVNDQKEWKLDIDLLASMQDFHDHFIFRGGQTPATFSVDDPEFTQRLRNIVAREHLGIRLAERWEIPDK